MAELTPLAIAVLALLDERRMHAYEMYQLLLQPAERPAGEGQARLALPHGRAAGRPGTRPRDRDRAIRQPARADDVRDHRRGPAGAGGAGADRDRELRVRVPTVPRRPERGAQPRAPTTRPSVSAAGWATWTSNSPRSRRRSRTSTERHVPEPFWLAADYNRASPGRRTRLADDPPPTDREQGTFMATPQEQVSPDVRPWPALWALVLGFFMILVDSTIVSVATPSILTDLQTDVGNVVWVTSAYLLAYAVPLLITGRLGDRIGPKKLYLAGLTVFTLASVWCGLTNSIEMLIIARVFQGLGASMMTPQTMAVITRIFPANERGKAMSLWGATAGVADPGRPDPRRRAGRRARLAVDLLHQRADRRDRLRAGLAAGAGPADARPQVRPGRRRAVHGRPVLPGVRHPGRPEVRLGPDQRADLGLVADHRRAAW